MRFLGQIMSGPSRGENLGERPPCYLAALLSAAEFARLKPSKKSRQNLNSTILKVKSRADRSIFLDNVFRIVECIHHGRWEGPAKSIKSGPPRSFGFRYRSSGIGLAFRQTGNREFIPPSASSLHSTGSGVPLFPVGVGLWRPKFSAQCAATSWRERSSHRGDRATSV